MFNNFILEDIFTNIALISCIIVLISISVNMIYSTYTDIKNRSLNNYCNDLELENEYLRDSLEKIEERWHWYANAYAKLECTVADQSRLISEKDNELENWKHEYEQLGFEHFIKDGEISNLKDLLTHFLVDYDLSKFKGLLAKLGKNNEDEADEWMYEQECQAFFSDITNRSYSNIVH